MKPSEACQQWEGVTSALHPMFPRGLIEKPLLARDLLAIWAMEIDPLYLLQLTVNGIMLGLLYALIAVGLALIFGVLEIVNFAHGEFLMAGAFAMAFALPATGLSYWPSLFAAVVVTAEIGRAHV